jgi:hypothetical protein
MVYTCTLAYATELDLKCRALARKMQRDCQPEDTRRYIELTDERDDAYARWREEMVPRLGKS